MSDREGGCSSEEGSIKKKEGLGEDLSHRAYLLALNWGRGQRVGTGTERKALKGFEEY